MTDFTHKVTPQDEGLEIKDIMRKHFNFSSRLRNKIKRTRSVYLNGAVTEGWLRAKAGDIITIKLPEEKSTFEPLDIPIDPVFEDEHFLIINKQPGIIVHPTTGHPSGTIANGVMNYMIRTGQSFKIRFVNRLDMDTSGLLVLSKNAYCQHEYTKQMNSGMVRKIYLAVVNGIIMEDSGVIDLPIGRPDPDNVRRGVMEDGSPSETHFRVLKRFERGYTLVQLELKTGRTHQIRVHMSHIGYPVLGDQLYGGEKVYLIERQALHASELSFIHPVTGEQLRIRAPLPDDIQQVLDTLS